MSLHDECFDSPVSLLHERSLLRHTGEKINGWEGVVVVELLPCQYVVVLKASNCRLELRRHVQHSDVSHCMMLTQPDPENNVAIQHAMDLTVWRRYAAQSGMPKDGVENGAPTVRERRL